MPEYIPADKSVAKQLGMLCECRADDRSGCEDDGSPLEGGGVFLIYRAYQVCQH